MKKLITSFLFAFTSLAFSQPASIVGKIEDGEVSIKANSFINAVSNIDNTEYAGLTFTFTPKDKSAPEDNYYKVQTSTCKDKTTALFETNKSGKLSDFKIANLQKTEALIDDVAQAICNTNLEYKANPEQFRQNTAFIQNVVNNSFRKQWNTLFENPTTDISSLKEYFKVESGIIYAIIRIQDLADKQVTSSEVAKINFPLSK